MKINSSNVPAALQTNQPRVAARSKVQSAGAVQQSSAADVTSSTVSLSSLSDLGATGATDIDTAKVESIKATLRDGTYRIDSGNIASGMLSSASELMKTQSH
ncbi:flagellar biosynthesis anti-sigma factor FlgM [Caballeronia sp. M23-90]